MRNAEIAEALAELATLYELDGAIRYRVLAYREAARVVRQSPVSVEELARAGRATELPGVGKTLEQKIVTLLDTGEIPSAAKLKRKFPASLIEVTMVPGVGAKTARRLYDELGVTSLDELRAAAEQERIRELKGLGPKAEENVLAALGKLVDGAPSERLLLSEVLPVAEQLAADLRAHPASDAVEPAGSVRRRTETCHDIDLIATASEPAALARALVDHPLAATKGSSGEGGARITTHNGVAVDLRIVAPAAYGNLLQHFTGSAEHNIELRERAVAMELSVSEHGITDTRTGEVSRYETEAGVYERLGLAYIEPELREATARSPPPPRARCQSWSRWRTFAATSIATPRSPTATTRSRRWPRPRGPAATPTWRSPTTPPATASAITSRPSGSRSESTRSREFNKGRRGFRLLAGSEVNILPDGSLDYADDLLAELDWAIASVHTSFKISQRAMTERVITAIEHPLVDCIGHLSGRLIARRDPYEIDVERVAEAAVRTGTMLEINGNPNRRDLSERHARLAAEAGVLICVNTDAHRVATLHNMAYGIATARRAWLTAEQVANTRPWREFARLRKRARR